MYLASVKYTGNNTDNPIVCGFEPAFVMIKASSNVTPWTIYDSQRGINQLAANSNEVENGSSMGAAGDNIS